MNCPVCFTLMTTADFGGAQVDVCNICKGMWFDWAELAKLDEPNEGSGKALEAALAHPRSNDANRPRLKCPKCAMPMYAHRYDAIEQVNVDECYACRGLFVDSGELKQIRHHLMSRDEENAYIEKLISEKPALRKHIQGTQLRHDEVEELRRSAFTRWAHFLRHGFASKHD